MRYLLAAIIGLATPLLTSCASAQTSDTPHPLANKPIALPQPPEPGTVDLPRFPAISPDASTITFSWRGDIWAASATGGQATRLTAHPGLETHSAWSPDGRQIAFNSDRDGFLNVYKMKPNGAGVTQLTHEDRYLFLAGWADNQTLSVTGYLEADVHKNPRPYRVNHTGGPITRVHDAFGRSPATSPDGRYIAFVRGRAPWDRPFLTNPDNRDLWLYDTQKKTFKRLTENPGNDGKPAWLDNDTVLYLSARPPARVNLYRMDIDRGEANATALTNFHDNDVQGFDVARGGKTAVMNVWDTLYTLDLDNAAAEPAALKITAPTDAGDLTLVHQLSGKTNEAALSPDGKVMAMSIHGELFVRTVESKNPPQRITDGIALDEQAAWSPDGKHLYFTSDRDGTLSIYRASVTLTRSEIEEALKSPKKEDKTNTPEAAALRADNQEDPDKPAPQEVDNELAEKGNNDDPEKTNDQADEQADKPKDAKPDPEPNPADRWHDAVRFEIEPFIVTDQHDSDPTPSPDGKWLAFRRGNGDVMLLDLETQQARVFLESWDSDTHWVWSPDSRYLAVSYEDQNHNADIWVGPIDGSAPLTNITKHPTTDVMPSFSLDGKVLAFISDRSNDQYDVYTVYLDKALETYTPQQLADYYEQAGKAAKQRKPLGADKPKPEAKGDDQAEDEQEKEDAKEQDAEEDKPAEEEKEPNDEAFEKPEPLDLEDAYLRLRRLTSTPENEWDAQITPAGDKAVFTRDRAVYTVGWDGKDEKKVVGGVDPQHLDLGGDKLVGIQSGTAVVVELGGGKVIQVQTPGSIRVDRRAYQRQRFDLCARALTRVFYDGTFKGIDWPAATAKYAQLAERAWTADEFDDVANRYLGLLNASHMGIRSPEPDAQNSEPNGRLGAVYQRVDRGYKVVSIEPKTPAAEGPMRLQVGDIITAIGFEPITKTDTVTARLTGRVGRETAVTVLREREGAPEPVELHLLLTPISYREYDDIRYDNWRHARQARVDEMSGGRLGYIHIEAMNASSLAEFERDLYAACEGRDGLIIDVRDNGGGWTTDRLLASIMTRRHAYTVPRGADPKRTNSYPNDRLFITRYNLPINAMCNENSFSNAEIFSHAFKTLERGTLVGNTTAGGVISTGGTRLLDGTTVRLPFRGWYLPDGTDMENNGAVPHLLVPQTPEDESVGKDAQLEAAVKDLLNRL